jgi:exopolysaccharide production protein ExoZ
MNSKLSSLQAGRGIAALMVLLFHLEDITKTYHPTSVLSHAFDTGFSGVDFFFVLSGFLIMYVHIHDLSQPSRILRYIYKRFVRLYPIYWLLCVGIIPLALLLSARIHSGSRLTPSILGYSLLLFPHQGKRLIDVTWTLEYEVTFYALFIFFMLSKKLGSIVFGLWGCTVLYVFFLGKQGIDAHGIPNIHPFALAFLLNMHCIEFFFGIFVALLIRNGFTFRRPAAALLLSFAAVFVFMVADTLHGYSNSHNALTSACYAMLASLIILFSVLVEQRQNLRLPAALHMLGSASYLIYLSQLPLISVARAVVARVSLLQSLPAGILLLLLITATLTPALLLHRLVEQPMLAWLSPKRALQSSAGS